MKKIFYFASAALALTACTSDEYLGETVSQDPTPLSETISFSPNNARVTKAASVGKDAAALLGGNFIVEGWKGAETTTTQASTVVFDNYLVVWGDNTAGTQSDNTHDWQYVGMKESNSTHIPENFFSTLNRTATEQTIKYWDYSTSNYAFVAYSTGTLSMTTGDPQSGTSVKVTKINDKWKTESPVGPETAYTFTAASAADFAKCYITDVIPVTNNNYGHPVTLTFKNLSAKVRIGLYETIPGYSVKDVLFYQDGLNFKFTKVSDPAKNGDNKLTTEYYSADGSTTYAAGTDYDSDKEYYSKDVHEDPTTNATFFLTGTNTFPEAGSIAVSYPLIGTDNKDMKGYNKADVTVNPVSGSTTTTKTFGALTANYTGKEKSETESNIYLGRSLSAATMAGTSTDNYFTAVMPVSTVAALTIRCNYTLVSTDGSGEEIKVWGAKAVVPASFCEWQPNYAYTYIFKISDNTNGSTENLGGGHEGLFPITFDAVYAGLTDASPEQTTVTTVATPSVTTYQAGHKKGEEYKAGDIYVEVMKEGTLETLTDKATLYTITNNTATEADVIDALQMRTSDTDGNVTGRNGLVLTKTSLLATDVTAIPGVDGNNITVTSGQAGKFTAAASTNYVFVYDYTTGSPDPSVIYSYDNEASTGSEAPSDWSADTTNPYYTKNNDGTTYTQVTTAWTAGTYYKKYTNNNHTYAVKVIKVGSGS